MIAYAPLGLTNAILPLAGLVALAIVVPSVLAGSTLSQLWLASAVLFAAALVLVVGAGIMAIEYATLNEGQSGQIGQYFQSSTRMALLWGPVLVLVWLMRAQGIERRKGLLMGRGDDETAD